MIGVVYAGGVIRVGKVRFDAGLESPDVPSPSRLVALRAAKRFNNIIAKLFPVKDEDDDKYENNDDHAMVLRKNTMKMTKTMMIMMTVD